MGTWPRPRAGVAVELFSLGGEEFAILELPAARPALPPALPAAEREVLSLLLAGLSNAEIACRRRRSPRTVAHQVEAVYRRLGVGSRQELFAALAAREEP